MTDKEANPFVPELDIFSKPDNETRSDYILKAIIKRVSIEVNEAYLAYTTAANRYGELIRLLKEYKNAND